MDKGTAGLNELDLNKVGIRGINQTLQELPKNTNQRHWLVRNPMGQHSIAVGLDAPLHVEIHGHVGFYCAGMNKESEIIVHGHAGVGVAENMMSGLVWIKGNASESAGATGNGGLLITADDRMFGVSEEHDVTIKFKLRDEVMDVTHKAKIIRKSSGGIAMQFLPLTSAVQGAFQRVVDDILAQNFSESQLI